MKMSSVNFLFLILFAWLCCGCKSDSVAPAEDKTYDFSSVDTFIEQHIDEYSGEVMVMVSQNGKLIYQKGIGLDETSVRPIASASKWLSAAVIMHLADNQKLTLDDTIGKYLPIFTANKKGNITIRQLFAHTAGFGGDSPQMYEYKRTMTLAEAVDSIAVYTPLVTKPGSTFDYGGAGMQIGGRIAEIVSGKSWQDLFDEKIGKPCDMTADYGLAKNPIIAGGARTSAVNYMRFLQMIVNKGTYNGTRVLSENAIATMLTDQTNNAVIANTPYPTNPFSDFPDKAVRYGVGNWLDVVDAGGMVLESSSPGLFGTHPWQDSKNKIAGIIFTQTTPRQSNLSSLQIRKMIRDLVEK